MRYRQIVSDLLEVQMHLRGWHVDRAAFTLEEMSSTYTSVPERDHIRGELLRMHIPIPECFGGNHLAGFYKTLNQQNTPTP